MAILMTNELLRKKEWHSLNTNNKKGKNGPIEKIQVSSCIEVKF